MMKIRLFELESGSPFLMEDYLMTAALAAMENGLECTLNSSGADITGPEDKLRHLLQGIQEKIPAGIRDGFAVSASFTDNEADAKEGEDTGDTFYEEKFSRETLEKMVLEMIG